MTYFGVFFISAGHETLHRTRVELDQAFRFLFFLLPIDKHTTIMPIAERT